MFLMVFHGFILNFTLNMSLAYKVPTQIWKRVLSMAENIPKLFGFLLCTGMVFGECDFQNIIKTAKNKMV